MEEDQRPTNSQRTPVQIKKRESVYHDTIDDINDSDEDSLTKSRKASPSPPKKIADSKGGNPSKKDTSVARYTDQRTQASVPSTAQFMTSPVSRQGPSAFGRSATEKFTQMFKLQKKTLNDEGLYNQEDCFITGRNSVNEKRGLSEDDDYVETPSDDRSDEATHQAQKDQQTDQLKLEYIKLKKTLQNIQEDKVLRSKSVSPSRSFYTGKHHKQASQNTFQLKQFDDKKSTKRQSDHEAEKSVKVSRVIRHRKHHSKLGSENESLFGLGLNSRQVNTNKHVQERRNTTARSSKGSPLKSRAGGTQHRAKQFSKKRLSDGSKADIDDDSVERDLLKKLQNECSIEYQDSNYLYSSADDAKSSTYTTKRKSQKQRHSNPKRRHKSRREASSSKTSESSETRKSRTSSRAKRQKDKSREKSKKLKDIRQTLPNESIGFMPSPNQYSMFAMPSSPMMGIPIPTETSYHHMPGYAPYIPQNSAMIMYAQQQQQYMSYLYQQMQSTPQLQQQVVPAQPQANQSKDPGNNFYTFNQSNILINGNDYLQIPLHIQVGANGQSSDPSKPQLLSPTSIKSPHGIKTSPRGVLQNQAAPSPSQVQKRDDSQRAQYRSQEKLQQVLSSSKIENPVSPINEFQSVSQQRKVLLNSPTSNWSRLDYASTNATGDYPNPSQPSSSLALASQQSVQRNELEQERIKQANQNYLDKLKNKFLSGMGGAVRDTIEEANVKPFAFSPSRYDPLMMSPKQGLSRNSVTVINHSIAPLSPREEPVDSTSSVKFKQNEALMDKYRDKHGISSGSGFRSTGFKPTVQVKSPNYEAFRQDGYLSHGVTPLKGRESQQMSQFKAHKPTTFMSSEEGTPVHRGSVQVQSNSTLAQQHSSLIQSRHQQKQSGFEHQWKSTSHQEHLRQSFQPKNSLQFTNTLNEGTPKGFADQFQSNIVPKVITFENTLSMKRHTSPPPDIGNSGGQGLTDIQSKLKALNQRLTEQMRQQKQHQPSMTGRDNRSEMQSGWPNKFDEIFSDNDNQRTETDKFPIKESITTNNSQLLVFDMTPTVKKPQLSLIQQHSSPVARSQNAPTILSSSQEKTIRRSVQVPIKSKFEKPLIKKDQDSLPIKREFDNNFTQKHKTPKRQPLVVSLLDDEPTDAYIEVLDNKSRKGHLFSPTSDSKSLADVFEFKKQLSRSKKDHKVFSYNEDSKLSANNEKLTSQKDGAGRTKEEILELRKQMMKSKVVAKKDNFVSPESLDQDGKKKGPPPELMQRLAMGQKSQVDMKEMKKLTNRNYENLPEIKKKKEEEKKKEELRQRQLMIKQYGKQIDQKRKQIVEKKTGATSDEFI